MGQTRRIHFEEDIDERRFLEKVHKVLRARATKLEENNKLLEAQAAKLPVKEIKELKFNNKALAKAVSLLESQIRIIAKQGGRKNRIEERELKRREALEAAIAGLIAQKINLG